MDNDGWTVGAEWLDKLKTSCAIRFYFLHREIHYLREALKPENEKDRIDLVKCADEMARKYFQEREQSGEL
jgi:hypothetical protein